MKAKMLVKVFMNSTATGIEAQMSEWLDHLDGVVIKTETHVTAIAEKPEAPRILASSRLSSAGQRRRT
jgi:hypothetical protein